MHLAIIGITAGIVTRISADAANRSTPLVIGIIQPVVLHFDVSGIRTRRHTQNIPTHTGDAAYGEQIIPLLHFTLGGFTCNEGFRLNESKVLAFVEIRLAQTYNAGDANRSGIAGICSKPCDICMF